MSETSNKEVVWMSDIESAEQQWLWEGVFPIGELTVIGGCMGIGKSLTTIDLAARVTTGRKWPDGTECKEGSILLMAAEDHLAYTVKPRLEAARADPSRVAAIRGTQHPKNKDILMPFNIQKDGTKIISTLTQMNEKCKVPVRALIIDPIASYMGGSDSGRDTVVREILGFLHNIAVRFDIAIILIMHVKKGAEDAPTLEKLLGSTAFTASARAVWVFCQCPENDDMRYFLPAKNNLKARTLQGWEIYVYSGINDHGAIKWGKTTTKMADDLLFDQGMAPEAKRSKAKELIVGILKEGIQRASKVREYVVNQDISEHTCNNAKKELGVRSAKSTDGEWYWWMDGLSKPPPGVKKKTETDKLKSAITKMISPAQEARRVQCVKEFERGDFGEPPEGFNET